MEMLIVTNFQWSFCVLSETAFCVIFRKNRDFTLYHSKSRECGQRLAVAAGSGTYLDQCHWGSGLSYWHKTKET
jgi:hypothetical protein